MLWKRLLKRPGPMRVASAGRTHRGCVRSLNEDSLLSLPAHGVYAVADGMGGHAAGDVASAAVVAAIEDACNDASESAIELAVRRRLQKLNADLLAMARDAGGDVVIGATLALLLVTDRRYVCVWAGDSRVYLLRAKRLTSLTRDHTLVQDLVDAGVLTPKAAQSDRRAHIVTRAIGARAELELEACEGVLQSGDRLLLCSDGLSSALGEAEVAKWLAVGDCDAAAGGLIARALKKHAADNVTAVVVDIERA